MVNGVYVNIGASNHSDVDRQVDDFYSTDPIALDLLLKKEKFSNKVWECAVGGGDLANVLIDHNYDVIGSDIVDRGFKDTKIINFINPSIDQIEEYKSCFRDRDIITNPPYKYLQEFLETGLRNLEDGHKMAIFVRIQALEGKARREIYNKYPLYKVYVPSSRIKCYLNGDKSSNASSAVCYCWMIWRKGYEGHTMMEWLD